MKIIIFGASGMVGQGALLECLDSPQIEAVLVIGRSPCKVEHPKLRELLHQDFFDYSAIEDKLTGYDACLFCLGTSSFRMTEEAYQKATYQLTMKAAETLLRLNPKLIFCYVSGAGTDSTEQGRSMWARVKGKLENDLLKMPFQRAYMFRPGYIQPMRGIKSKTKVYQAMYTVFGSLYPVLNAVAPRFVTTTEKLGRAMINAVTRGAPKQVLESDDINALAG